MNHRGRLEPVYNDLEVDNYLARSNDYPYRSSQDHIHNSHERLPLRTFGNRSHKNDSVNNRVPHDYVHRHSPHDLSLSHDYHSSSAEQSHSPASSQVSSRHKRRRRKHPDHGMDSVTRDQATNTDLSSNGT